eukprot:6205574-Pleurochrysis_carterae.AAC.1
MEPRTRKQAMAEDRVGWGQAERAEIANHAANDSWTMIDRSQVPANSRLCGSCGFTSESVAVH